MSKSRCVLILSLSAKISVSFDYCLINGNHSSESGVFIDGKSEIKDVHTWCLGTSVWERVQNGVVFTVTPFCPVKCHFETRA